MLFRERIAYPKDRMKIIGVGAKIYIFSPANLLHTISVHFFCHFPAHFQKRYTVHAADPYAYSRTQ
jgi:azurin